MPGRRSSSGPTIGLIKLAQVLGQAWSGARTIERRYPRIFAAAVADAMQLSDEDARSFIDLLEREHVGIEASKQGRGFR